VCVVDGVEHGRPVIVADRGSAAQVLVDPRERRAPAELGRPVVDGLE
jgi:hypothetical protein